MPRLTPQDLAAIRALHRDRHIDMDKLLAEVEACWSEREAQLCRLIDAVRVIATFLHELGYEFTADRLRNALDKECPPCSPPPT